MKQPPVASPSPQMPWPPLIELNDELVEVLSPPSKLQPSFSLVPLSSLFVLYEERKTENKVLRVMVGFWFHQKWENGVVGGFAKTASSPLMLNRNKSGL